jgi:crotonobetainyl-CoA:carnitine CoA-transferase CaiB-like acyl-CoA transferase
VGGCRATPAGHRLAGRPAYDALVQASSGQMTDQPGWRNGPIFLHLPLPSMGAMFLVPSALTAALVARERTGSGQHVSTSLLQGALLFTTQIWQEVSAPGAAFHAVLDKTYPPGVHQQMLFECAGGEWLHLSVMSGLTPLKPLDEIVGVPDAPDALTAMGMTATERAALDGRRRAAFRAWERGPLIDELRRNNHAVDPVTPAAEMFAHPQTVANGTAVDVVDPDMGRTTQVGIPIHLLGTPGAVRGPQPRVGEHDAEVLAGLPAAAPGRVPRPAADGKAPLAGIRLLDFGQYLAGPFGPMVLGDLGADVVKIEPVNGDSMRFAGKPFVGCQRGKRSLALDLKHPEGREVALRLVSGADVVHHNMTRGVATRLGIDYPACREVRPDIIYCNTYAYGLPDPLGRYGGLDPLYQASSGIEHEAGAVATGNAPLYLRFGMCDTSNAMLSAVGVLLALFHRLRTGEGQELWTSLHDGGLIFSSDVWLGPDGRPWDRPHLDAGLHGLGPRYRLYATQDGGWICVAAVTGAQGTALREVTGAASDAGLVGAFRTRTALQWTRLLDDAGVPNDIPVDSRDGSTALHDGDNERLGLVTEYDHPMLGRLRQFGALFSFSGTPARIAGPPPLVGQHSREILHEAGYRDGDIDDLVAAGAVYQADDRYRERFTL